ncbi:hypothetical protein D3C80_1706920 [compost metagenome]
MRLQAIEREAKSDDQEYRHDHAQPALVQPVLNVESGATVKLTTAVVALVQLRQATFKERGSHSDQRGNPHPEDRSRSAQRHRHADASNVTRTDPAGQAEHEGLERADLRRTAG